MPRPPRRQLGLEAHDAVDVHGFWEQGADAFDAGAHVGDARVEVGELLGHILGQLVERRQRAEVLEHGIVVEVTGRLVHSTPTERARDAQRRNELIALGLKVYEYTWAQVTERPADVITSMRARLAAAQKSFMSRGSA